MKTDDRSAVDRHRNRVREAELRRVSALTKLMQDEDGRAFISWLLRKCGVYETIHPAGGPEAMAFRLGERNIGLLLLQEIYRRTPYEYPRMLNEALSDEIALRPNEEPDDARRENATDA